MSDREFFTFSEYMKKEVGPITASMEDYLEMITRLSRDSGFTRIHDLATALNVQPPSVTKMIQRLASLGLVNYEKYGVIVLTANGSEIGNALLKRHNIVEEFLRLLGINRDLLEETEKIEHTVSEQTLKCFQSFSVFLHSRPEVIKDFQQYLQSLQDTSPSTSREITD